MGSLAKSKYIVTIVEYPAIIFTTLTGGDVTVPTKVVQRGGGLKEVVEGPPQVEPITIDKPFDLATDLALLKLKSLAGRGLAPRLTVKKIPISAVGTPIGSPTIYTSCAISSINDPEADAESGDEARFSITLQPTGQTS